MVSSLYFDTPGLEEFRRTEDGEAAREKIRLRWYDEDYARRRGDNEIPVFVEVKSRSGHYTTKRRRRVTVPIRDLERSGIARGILGRGALLEILAALGVTSPGRLHPVLLVSYHRRRFTELTTGLRVAVDDRIHSRVVAPGIGYSPLEVTLEGGVLEIKGPPGPLPLPLMRLQLLEADWSSSSKYASCMETHLEHPGSRGWRWPAGIVEGDTA